MKRVRFTSSIAASLTLCLAAAVCAQNDLEEADHEALRGLRAVFEEAVNKNEMDRLKPYLDQDFSVVTFTDREFTDFEKFKARWQKTRDEMLKGGTYTVDLLPVRSQILGDIAIAKGDSKNVMVTGDGKRFEFTAHWTAVCRKTDGEWRILRGHNSIDPFGNPMLKSAVRGILIKLVATAGVLGLVIGWIGRMVVGRRKAVACS